MLKFDEAGVLRFVGNYRLGLNDSLLEKGLLCLRMNDVFLEPADDVSVIAVTTQFALAIHQRWIEQLAQGRKRAVVTVVWRGG